MYQYLIDLNLVKKVWRNLEQIDDARIAEEKGKIRNRCQALLNAAFGETITLSPDVIDQAATFSREQLAKESLRVITDVLAFVSGACACYDIVRSSRPLSEEEKDIGTMLSSLLQQVRTTAPGGNTNP